MATATDSSDLGFRRRKRSDFKHEPYALADLVVKTGDEKDRRFFGFVKYRFRRPFLHSLKWSMRYGFAVSALSLLAIGAGLASTTLAAVPGTNDVAIGLLGLLVALTTAVNRVWRPGLRAVVGHRTANDLRREGWEFVCGRGKYAEVDQAGRTALFIDSIERINASAEMVDEEPIDDERGTSADRRRGPDPANEIGNNGHSADVPGTVPA